MFRSPILVKRLILVRKSIPVRTLIPVRRLVRSRMPPRKNSAARRGWLVESPTVSQKDETRLNGSPTNKLTINKLTTIKLTTIKLKRDCPSRTGEASNRSGASSRRLPGGVAPMRSKISTLSRTCSPSSPMRRSGSRALRSSRYGRLSSLGKGRSSLPSRSI